MSTNISVAIDGPSGAGKSTIARAAARRFGLVYVDYKTQKRTIKDSGYWYRDVIATNGEKLLVPSQK